MKKLLLILLTLVLLASVSQAVQLGQGLGDKFDSVSVGTTEVVSNISTGAYTPILTNTTNIASSTAGEFNWLRVGNKVFCGFEVLIDPTSTGQIVLNFTLPIACSTTPKATGFCGAGGYTESGVILANSASLARVIGETVNVGPDTWQGTFMYVIN